MAKLKELERRKIIDLLKQGLKVKNIAANFNVDPATIWKIRDNYLKNGESSFIIKKTGPKDGTNLTIEQRKILELEQKIQELEEDIELQKKFQAYLDEVRMNKEK